MNLTGMLYGAGYPDETRAVRPGSIVRFRNRDWVLLPSANDEVVRLRPLTGTTDDVVEAHRVLCELVQYDLASESISPSQFPLPSADAVADAQSLHLLWQAARLLLREGATPFRSLGRVSVRPRTYQLVPLMMALRLDPVRLLIADDVGVGKTIEAGLILRELWDRGEISRFAVLCPPYLCDQWEKELREKFHFEVVVIGSGTISQLERRLPRHRSIYEHYPAQVISVDFVKYPRNKHSFLLHAPELIIVDEAHGCTPGRGQERHLRFQLVRELADDQRRHILLLTATPHSGIQESFQKLLGLIDPQFEAWDLNELREEERRILARHFVQRTRRDIQSQWEGTWCFPTREPVDATYSLSPAYQRLFQSVYDFCNEIVESGWRLEARRRRMRWWAALALLRCVMSSPRAAAVALQERAERERPEGEEALGADVFVVEPHDRLSSDEPPTDILVHAQAEFSTSEKQQLRALRRLAESISESDDKKLLGCIEIVQRLLSQGFYPVIWCYYVETAEYVAEKLREQLARRIGDVAVLCLTGRVGEQERRQRVNELMAEPGPRVLVATDCLSEGINLQHGFNAVVHYDLPWNPNRLEQREGRVDRYEQRSPVVKAVRYYGYDNPVDGAVIRVLLDKAKKIRNALGTHVPVPVEEEFLVEALVHELFWRRSRRAQQLPLQLGASEAGDPVEEIHRKWDLDAEREKLSRTRFAQHALKPEEVRKELEATDQVLGDPAAVRNFVLLAGGKLGLQIKPGSQEDVWEILTEEAALQRVPDAIRQALPPGSQGSWKISFTSPTPEGAEYLGRNHRFVTALARFLFEQALSGAPEAVSARCGAIRTRAVSRLTTLLLLRPRFQLEPPQGPPLLAEEVLVTGWRAYTDHWLEPEEALALLTAEPSANVPLSEKRELVHSMLQEVRQILEGSDGRAPLRRLLAKRAQELEEAHRRVRRSVGLAVRGYTVRWHWPPDLLGLLVLQPEVNQ